MPGMARPLPTRPTANRLPAYPPNRLPANRLPAYPPSVIVVPPVEVGEEPEP